MNSLTQFVTSIPSPYQVDFFDALQRIAPDSFSVVFCAAQEIDRQYYQVPEQFSFEATILNHSIRTRGKDFHRNSGIQDALEQSDAANVIVGGNYFMPDARSVRRHCVRAGKRFFFWGENPHKKLECTGQEARGLKVWLKELYIQWFLRPASGVIGIGCSASDNYRRLSGNRPGVSIPYAPNLEAFENPTEEVLEKKKQLRARIGGDDGILILFAGSLIPLKDPATLIESFGRVSERQGNVRLMLAGEGPLRPELEGLVATLGISDRVSFLGYLRGDELKAAYLASDIFVLPTVTYEGWGVVVQEAMAAGLAVVASSRVGAALDLFAGNEAGKLFTAGSVEELSGHLMSLAGDQQLRAELAASARKSVAGTGADSAAKKLLEFVNSIP